MYFRTQTHDLMSSSFRVNIVGFANAPGSDTNVALRDVRLAVEWVRSNIAAFGGDADSIIMFGQSQGAYLISYYSYAYAEDPIASGFIEQSGTALSPVARNSSMKVATWYNASASVGCNQTTDAETLSCMQSVDLSTVLAAWSAVQVPSPFELPMGPVIDDVLIFGDYPNKTQAGEFAQRVRLNRKTRRICL